jgi:hypothetical protein
MPVGPGADEELMERWVRASSSAVIGSSIFSASSCENFPVVTMSCLSHVLRVSSGGRGVVLCVLDLYMSLFSPRRVRVGRDMAVCTSRLHTCFARWAQRVI